MELCYKDKGTLEPIITTVKYRQYGLAVPALKCQTCGEVYISDENMKDVEATAQRIKEAKIKETIGLMPDALLAFSGIVLKRLTEEGKPMNVKDIAQSFLDEKRYDTFETAKSAVTRALRTLEEYGLIGKMPGPKDRREHLYAPIRVVTVPQSQEVSFA